MLEYEAEVDETIELILRSVTESSSELGIKWFICGASARVLLCERVSGMRVGRATRDLDIAVSVNSFREYEAFRKLLRERFDFHPDRHKMQRLWHANGSPIDIIPFGGIGKSTNTVIWGENSDIEMNVLGFDEALSSAILVRINSGLTVLVASYAEQFVLKLLAWSDRHARSETEDSRDIAYFLRNADGWYSDDTIYDTYAPVLGNVDYDVELATAHILGCNIGNVFQTSTISAIMTILDHALSEPLESILVRDIAREIYYENPEERVIALLEQVRLGIQKKV